EEKVGTWQTPGARVTLRVETLCRCSKYREFGMTRFQSYRWAGAAVTTLGLFAATVTGAGQPPRPRAPLDPIEAAKLQKSLSQQKAEREAETDVRLALDNASNLMKTGRTAEATKILNTAIQNLQFKAGISDATRTQLTGQLKAKLNAIDGK